METAVHHIKGITYQRLRSEFWWRLPPDCNIGTACADLQHPDALALIEVSAVGAQRRFTFGDLTELSNRFANGLAQAGVGFGDRVGVVLPQRVEVGIAHLAIYKLGAVAVPLSGLFGPEALAYRLGDSGARAVITDAGALEVVTEVAGKLGDLTVVVADRTPTDPNLRSFWELLDAGSSSFQPAITGPNTAALLIYTSGTTGPPKGALHGHRVLWGHLPGFELMYEFFPQEHDVVWTPADWAWIGGLMDALLPAWYHGRPVVGAARGGFDPEWGLDLMARHQVTAAFLPPTALKMMRQAGVARNDLALRTLMSGGEPLGEEMLGWARQHLGAGVNEIFGQTEANLVVGNCSRVWEVRPGSMGRPFPGHDVTIVDDHGQPLGAGEVGQIAVRSPDPVMFLEYWNQPEATEAKFVGDRLMSGDLASRDEDGYFWFQARADDVIASAGYRIGPTEIEECLMALPAVAMAAVIGVPDEIRGHVVKAFIVPAEGFRPGPELEEEIRQRVRSRLAAYEYPRYVEFVDELPLTTTGKIQRGELRRREAQATPSHLRRADATKTKGSTT
ncbi:MAG: AMP-binding protein [Acidimicrobiia bacterium]